MSTQVPIGVGQSFSDVPINSVVTTTFGLDAGYAIVTFQAIDRNDPGVATLFDGDGNTIVTLDEEGYANVFVPSGGKTYYFSATKGANLLALTHPSIGWR